MGLTYYKYLLRPSPTSHWCFVTITVNTHYARTVSLSWVQSSLFLRGLPTPIILRYHLFPSFSVYGKLYIYILYLFCLIFTLNSYALGVRYFIFSSFYDLKSMLYEAIFVFRICVVFHQMFVNDYIPDRRENPDSSHCVQVFFVNEYIFA